MFKILFIFGVLMPLGLYAQDYVEGEAIVHVSCECNGEFTDITSIDSLNRVFEVHEVAKLWRGEPSEIDIDYGLDRVYLFRFSAEKKISDFIRAYSRNRWVELVEPNYLYKLSGEPDDPLFSAQWNLRRILCPEGWEVQIGTDSTILAVVDGGLEWQHPDLTANLWINEAEDINSNGEFDPWPDSLGGDLDSIDNDLNGYVDDVIGWDWKGDDNDPTPTLVGEDHGTWCNGIANAVTDNAQGIAGVAYNCKSMAFRCTFDATHIDLAAAIQAINYANAKGAHVISCSWGGYGFSPACNNAIQAAHASGMIICGAAGNENTDELHYPSCYDNVIAVAATDHGDSKSSYSNYGDWIDVCAPGDNVYGTEPGGDYGQSYGTSGSCPQVAGLAALMRSRFPDSSNTFIENVIFNSCDSILDTLFSQGRLGHGRINVFNALATPSYCWLELQSFSLDDSTGGNGNGRAEWGDTLYLTINVLNRWPWSDAHSVTAKLRTDNPWVTILDSISTFADVPSGSTANNQADRFIWCVDSIPPTWLNFSLEWQSNPESHNYCDSFRVLFDFPDLVLVDDDNGEDYEIFYERALDSLNLVWDIWCVESQGALTHERLVACSTLIWFTGDDSVTTLMTQDQELLSDFSDSGGNLFLTGQDIGKDIGSTPFYSDYLRAEFSSDNSYQFGVVGVEGDPVGDGLLFAITGGDGANNQHSPDIISPLLADSCFEYRYGIGTCGVRHGGGYKLVYLSFGFEGIYSSEARLQLMDQILSWFGYSIGIEAGEEISIMNQKVLVFPNPFSHFTNILFSIPRRGKVSLKLYDIQGRRVKILLEGDINSGTHQLVWSRERNLPNGVYFYELIAPEFRRIGKIILLR